MDHKDTQVAWSLDDKSPVDIGDRDEWEFDGYDKKGRALWTPNKTGAEKAGRNKTHFCCSQLHVPLKVNQGRDNKWSFSAVTSGQNLSSCDLLPMIAEFHNSIGEGARHRNAKEILTQFLESSDARDEFEVKKVYPDGYQIPGESVQPDITIEHIDDSYTYVEIVDTHAPHQNHIAWMFYETRQAQLVVIDVDDDRGWHYDKHLIQKLLIKKFERYFNDPVRTNAPKTWDERVQRHIPIAGLISKWVGEHLQEEDRLASELVDARTEAVKKANLIKQINEIDDDPPENLDSWLPHRLEERLSSIKDEQKKWKEDSMPLSEALAEVFESLEKEEPWKWESIVDNEYDGDSEPLKLLLKEHYQGLSGKLRDGRIQVRNLRSSSRLRGYNLEQLEASILNNCSEYDKKERYEESLNSVISDFDDTSLGAIQVMANASRFLLGIIPRKFGGHLRLRPNTDDWFGFFWDKTIIDGDNLVKSKLSELFDKDKEAWIGKNPGYSKTYDEEYRPKMEAELEKAEIEERRVAKFASKSGAQRADITQWNMRKKRVKVIEEEMKMDVYQYVRNQIDTEFFQISRSVVSAIS